MVMFILASLLWLVNLTFEILCQTVAVRMVADIWCPITTLFSSLIPSKYGIP